MSGRPDTTNEIAPRRRGDGDDGVTMILVALTMVGMMVFAAFAVDMGGVYAERRQDQTAADVAALAAVLLGELDPIALDPVDRTDMHAVRADHLHAFFHRIDAHCCLLVERDTPTHNAAGAGNFPGRDQTITSAGAATGISA